MDKFAAGTLCLLISYFAYHAFAGDAGLGEYADMQTELAEKRKVLKGLEREVARLEADIARLTPETADPNYIETLARQKLAFVFPDELVLTSEN
ncbi:MAG: septum formation initiator family protein [Pseudomonadota bacterium]